VPPLGLRPADAANALGVSMSTLDRLTRMGEIACVKLDRAKIYYYEELRRWICSKTEAARKCSGSVAGDSPCPPSIELQPIAYTIRSGYYGHHEDPKRTTADGD
jgi:hypothetical protein